MRCHGRHKGVAAAAYGPQGKRHAPYGMAHSGQNLAVTESCVPQLRQVRASRAARAEFRPAAIVVPALRTPHG